MLQIQLLSGKPFSQRYNVMTLPKKEAKAYADKSNEGKKYKTWEPVNKEANVPHYNCPDPEKV